MDEENQDNVNTTGKDKEKREQKKQNKNQNNAKDTAKKAEKVKKTAVKFKGWIKYLPIIIKVVIITIIVIILVGIIMFFTTMPSMYLENVKEFGLNLWGSIIGFFTGDNITATVTEEDQIELAQRIQDMGYDIVGYGFADATYEYDNEANAEDVDGITNGKITKVSPFAYSNNYLQAYIAQSEATYVLSTWSIKGRLQEIGSDLKDLLNSILGNDDEIANLDAKGFSEGMINITNLEDIGLGVKVTVDRENKLLRIQTNNAGIASFTPIGVGDVYYYDMSDWTSIYGKPLELFLALHLGTMMPDLAYEFATADCFNTKVNIELQEVEATYKVIYKKEDETEIYQPELEQIYLKNICNMTDEQIARFESAGKLDEAFKAILNSISKYREDWYTVQDNGTLDYTIQDISTHKGFNLTEIEKQVLGEEYSKVKNVTIRKEEEIASDYNGMQSSGNKIIKESVEDLDRYIRVIDTDLTAELSSIQNALNSSTMAGTTGKQLADLGDLILDGMEEKTTYLPRITSVIRHWYLNDINFEYGKAGKAKKKIQYTNSDEESSLSEENLDGASIILDTTYTSAEGIYYQLAEPEISGPNDAVTALFKGGSGSYDGVSYTFLAKYYRYDGTRLTAQKIANAKALDKQKENPQIVSYYFQGEPYPVTGRENEEWNIEKQEVTFTTTDENGNVSNNDALTAFAILENMHSIEAETAYRMLKELVINLGYFTEEDFMRPLNQVLLWPVERVGSDTNEDDEEAENLTKGIYKKENEYGLFLENGVAVNSGDSIIAPGDAIVESVDGNTIKLKFKSISDGNAQALKDKFGTDYFDVDRDIVLDMEMTITGINVSVSAGQEVTAGTQIGTATGEDVRILMFNIDKSLVEDIETYMYPTYKGTYLGIFEKVRESQE